MNGTEHFAMTGSSNPRTEQLAWLSEVASAVSKGTLNRHIPEQTVSSFAPPSVLAGGGRMFVPPFQTERPATPYYSQAPRNAPYSNFFQATYTTPMAFSSSAITTSTPNPQETQHSYIQIDTYQPPIGVQTVGPTHAQGFLQLQSSPTHSRLAQGRSILIRSPEEPAHVQSSALAQILEDSSQRKSLESSSVTEPEPCLQRTSPYRMPSGKEGSLKHRILRPPSINIVDPPPSLLMDAPLSAPPLHTQPSPKQPRSLPSSGYRSFSSSASSPPPAQLKYPQSFMKGAIIQLANNKLKHVEHMTTEDFIECGLLSPTLRIDSSTVTSIEKTPSTGAAKLGFHVGQDNIQITVEAPLEHPFFVYRQGWSSCSPERSAQRYGLTCHRLKVGDTCVSLTDKPRPSLPPHEQDTSVMAKGDSRKRRWSAPDNISPAEDDV